MEQNSTLIFMFVCFDKMLILATNAYGLINVNS